MSFTSSSMFLLYDNVRSHISVPEIPIKLTAENNHKRAGVHFRIVAASCKVDPLAAASRRAISCEVRWQRWQMCHSWQSEIYNLRSINTPVGFDLLRLESVDEAAQLFTTGTDSHPSSPRLWLARGVAESLQQKNIAAIQSLFHAVSLDPNLQPAYSFLANLCGLSSEADAGITSAISKFVVAHPHNAIAHYDLAMALWGRHDGASSVIDPRIVSELKLAIANDPRLGSAHFRLGVLYSDARNYQDAALELRKAIELEPEKPDWHYRLFLAYRGGKQFEQADQELKVFEKMRERSNPSNDETVQ